MYKSTIRVLLLLALLLGALDSCFAQYSKSIKLEYTASFDALFNTGGEWEGVDSAAVKSTILSRVSDDYSVQGISVSETSGNMVVKIGGTNSGYLGLAISGIGSFVSGSSITAEVYSTEFSTIEEWQDDDATVARIATALANTASHEAAHLLNCRHAYASHTFDPTVANHLYNDHLPKEPGDLVGTTGDDYTYKYINIMATGNWKTEEQLATVNQGWSNSSNLAVDFGTGGGSTVTYNAVWGIDSRSWTQANNVTVNSSTTLLIGAPSYTHSLNGKYIKATGTGKITLFNGLSGSYWKNTNSSNTLLYGLYPSSASAIANYSSGQAVRDASDNIIYPTAPTAPTSFHVDGDIGEEPYLNWSGATGTIDEYNIYRKYVSDTEWMWIGSTSSTNYTDTGVNICDPSDPEAYEYEYHVKASNAGGESSASISRSIYSDNIEWKISELALPKEFTLSQNYPNPFNPVTSIKYALPQSQNVILRVYSITGQLVATLVNESKSAGYHDVQWDASSVASGVYIYTISAGSFSETKKMVVMK